MIVGELPLVGGGGEPVSFARTLYSHGCAQLAPARIERSPLRYVRAMRLGNRVAEIVLRAEGTTLVAECAQRLSAAQAKRVCATIAQMFRLDDDLSGFYRLVAEDPLLRWAGAGAGRMLGSPTVFEEVVKTICTTNCAWSSTQRMTTALAELGGAAFPEPELLAGTRDAWYRDVARMGYRGPYVKAIARDVAAGGLKLEALRDKAHADDDAVEAALLALPGIGPYAAAHVMQLLGRHRKLVLDSWTRPAYARLAGRRRMSDATICRAFKRYGEFAGLAFWLFLTRHWVSDGEA